LIIDIIAYKCQRENIQIIDNQIYCRRWI